MGFWTSLINVLPKLKTKIHLAGLTLVVGGFVATRLAVPDQILSQFVGGSFGVPLILIALVFQRLEQFPVERRERIVITSIVVFLLFELGILAGLIYTLRPKERIVPYGVRIRNIEEIDLKKVGWPARLDITVDGERHSLSRDMNQAGEGRLTLPAESREFKITSALWRGFRLESPRNEQIAIQDQGILITFSKSDFYIDGLEVSQVKELARKSFGLVRDSEVNDRLGLRPLDQGRSRTTELRSSWIEIRNETGAPIIPTFFDCDEFVWRGEAPFGVACANIGTVPIPPHHSREIRNVFDSMSAHCKVFAVLVCWEKKDGTKTWYCLAGFITIRPEDRAEDRRYQLTIVDRDAELVTLKPAPAQSSVQVIQFEKE